jgi:hypothetical protein
LAGKRDVEILLSLGFSTTKIATRLGMDQDQIKNFERTIAREQRNRNQAEARSLLRKRRNPA